MSYSYQQPSGSGYAKIPSQATDEESPLNVVKAGGPTVFPLEVAPVAPQQIEDLRALPVPEVFKRPSSLRTALIVFGLFFLGVTFTMLFRPHINASPQIEEDPSNSGMFGCCNGMSYNQFNGWKCCTDEATGQQTRPYDAVVGDVCCSNGNVLAEEDVSYANCITGPFQKPYVASPC
jgi:hypothetical protein